MPSVFWKKIGDNYLNQAGPGPMLMLGVGTDGISFFIQATVNGVDWIQDTTNPFTSPTTARTALANYVGTLNAGTATG